MIVILADDLGNADMTYRGTRTACRAKNRYSRGGRVAVPGIGENASS
jgi:hypothetical protein